MLRISRQPEGFSDWSGLLELLRDSFAYMHDRIDPPSSMNQLDLDGIKAKATTEQLVLAWDQSSLIGCLFARPQTASLYVGKIAVIGAYRGRGVARQLLDEANVIAREYKLDRLELQVRIELIENQAAFARLGFVITGEDAHPGYDRPTSITMQLRVPERTDQRH